MGILWMSTIVMNEESVMRVLILIPPFSIL